MSWARKFVYAFPHCSHRKGSSESKSGSVSDAHNNPSMARPTMVSRVFKMSVKNPLLLPALKELLKDPAGKLNPLVIQNSLVLIAWTISDRTYLQKEYRKGLLTLS